MLKQKRKINLSLPTSYNRCTVKQLRAIASVMIDLAARSSPLQPYTADDLKVAVFFRLANLEVVDTPNTSLPVEEQAYSVRFLESCFQRIISRIIRRNLPFDLHLWQIGGWLFKQADPNTGKETRGQLDWLDCDTRDFFVVFPFSAITRRAGFFCRDKLFKGPNPMLDGFTWQRYRFAQDYMQNYIDQQNRLVRLQKRGRRTKVSDLMAAIRALDNARALFLANLFEAKIEYTDESTGLIRRDFRYHPEQASENVRYFHGFPDVDWQIVLLWWSGIMGWLGHTYPKVFKVQDTRRNTATRVNPLEVYARTTATMEKYIGISAEAVEREPYNTILQQMNDIVVHNEEMERMNKKAKK